METKRFENRAVIVTGASLGIGRATALAFAREGARVVVADIQHDEGENTIRMIRELGSKAIYVKTDVSRETDVQYLVRKAVGEYGRLDCAVNNAGIGGKPAPIGEMPREDWDRVIGINLTGVFLCMTYEVV